MPEAASAPEPARPEAGWRAMRTGPGRVLVAVYAVFALSATARAGVQILTKLGEAPLAYLLSAFAALVYVVATVSLARSTSRSFRVALSAVVVELVGVVTVGLLSIEDPVAFPDATVWSRFGAGYGYVPLALPVLGLLWLRHVRRAVRRPTRAGGHDL